MVQDLIEILKVLIESMDLATYSYVKPGAPHRYSTYYKDIHCFIRLLTSSLPQYFKAVEMGEEIAKGRSRFVDAEIGRLIGRAIRSSSRALEKASLPELHIVLVPAVVAASYSIKSSGHMSIDTYRKGVSSLLLYNGEEDTLKLFEELRRAGGEIHASIEYSGITPGRIKTENMSLHDLLTEASKRHKIINFYVTRHSRIVELGQRFAENYLKTGDLNQVTVKIYGELLEAVYGIKTDLNLRGKDDFMRLLKEDNSLHRKGEHLHGLLPVLTEAVFVGHLLLEKGRGSS